MVKRCCCMLNTVVKTFLSAVYWIQLIPQNMPPAHVTMSREVEDEGTRLPKHNSSHVPQSATYCMIIVQQLAREPDDQEQNGFDQRLGATEQSRAVGWSPLLWSKLGGYQPHPWTNLSRMTEFSHAVCCLYATCRHRQSVGPFWQYERQVLGSTIRYVLLDQLQQLPEEDIVS